MSNRNLPKNVTITEQTDSVNVKAVSGNAVQVHADNAVWDTVLNRYLSVDTEVTRKK
jgi:hypothetical protein